LQSTYFLILESNNGEFMKYETIKLNVNHAVGLITLDRPKTLNALSEQLMSELSDALSEFERNVNVGAIVITGNEKAFAAGADIKGMIDQTCVDAYLGNFIGRPWHSVSNCRKPVIAAVSGYALGGGCELAMMCDFIIASDTAKFGQTEIKLGIIPGAGGTQRLTRFVGKSKAMDMCLTGRLMSAEEAERSGLVSRVVPIDRLLPEAIDAATTIANLSRPSVFMVKEAINHAYESTLSEGIKHERSMFVSLFSTKDQTEGMQAFIEKREPRWNNK
jgi:enoyl-CoA hydratase